jgi:hypothetical protein
MRRAICAVALLAVAPAAADDFVLDELRCPTAAIPQLVAISHSEIAREKLVGEFRGGALYKVSIFGADPGHEFVLLFSADADGGRYNTYEDNSEETVEEAFENAKAAVMERLKSCD